MTLGLTMIVKNEEAVLARALENMRGIADEIVIVDTGSTDGTVELARSIGGNVKVYFFDWCDDFAAARNFALSKVTADYWMWLDADDIVPQKTAAAIGRLVHKSQGEFDAVMLPYVLKTAPDGRPAFSFYRERIIRTGTGFVWKGRVHEAVSVGGRVLNKNYPIMHGKPSERSAGSRNLDIYRKMLDEGVVLDPRESYYYARELYYNGLYDQAAKAFKAFLTMRGGFIVNKIDACIMLSQCYDRLGDTQAALTAALDSFRYGPPTGEACCRLGALFFGGGDYRSAAYWYNCALRARPDKESGAFVDADYYSFIPLVWLTVCYDRLGNTPKAYRYHLRAQKLRPEHPSVKANQAYFDLLGY